MYAQEGLSEAWTGVSYESRTITIHLPWIFMIIPVMLNTTAGVAVNEMVRPWHSGRKPFHSHHYRIVNNNVFISGNKRYKELPFRSDRGAIVKMIMKIFCSARPAITYSTVTSYNEICYQRE